MAFLGAGWFGAVITVDIQGTTLSWFFYDGHDKVVRTMPPSFTLSAFQFRGVWGERESDLGLGKGYCANLGHPEDETGLVYMRARYYEPWTGRFISEDPSRNGINWFAYANNNPVNLADLSGRAAQALLLLIAEIALAILVFGAVVGAVYELIYRYRHYGAIISWKRVGLRALEGFVTALVTELFMAGAMALIATGSAPAIMIGVIFAIEGAIILGIILEIWGEAMDMYYPLPEKERKDHAGGWSESFAV